MTFASDLSPFLLLFALLPLAIYLLFRRRYHKRTFGAMHILHRAYRKVRRSLRVKEMILLALRTLALVVLVLALLQPVLSDALGSENTAWLFVLDSSLSMRATNPSGSRFRAAKDFISSRIEYSARGDRFALLPFDDEPGELLGPVDDADSARAISEKLQPGYAATAITPKLLEKIITLAAEAAKDGYVPHVMFVSDLAANPWGGLSSSPQLLKLFDKLADTALITFVDCSKGISENLSVKSLEPSRDLFCSGLDVDITAAVVNHSARETSSVLAIDREEFALTSDSLTLNAGSQGELSARERPDSQGPVFYRASLPDDVLVEDNVRLLAARVRDRLSVLIVDGRASRKNFENASSFLKHALRPSTREGLSPLIPAVIDLAQLETAQLDNTDVLVLASVPGLTDGSAKKVERFVSRGGALVVTCGEGTNRDGLHRALGDILPVILDETVTAADGEWFPAGSMRLPEYARRSQGPLLRGIQEPEALQFHAKQAEKERSTARNYSGWPALARGRPP
ncbi:MAG: VWA domain-containing protein [Planctomycetota bacterium]|nr:VWA domain-containing protein [Planctomycetota bacterium]